MASTGTAQNLPPSSLPPPYPVPSVSLSDANKNEKVQEHRRARSTDEAPVPPKRVSSLSPSPRNQTDGGADQNSTLSGGNSDSSAPVTPPKRSASQSANRKSLQLGPMWNRINSGDGTKVASLLDRFEKLTDVPAGATPTTTTTNTTATPSPASPATKNPEPDAITTSTSAPTSPQVPSKGAGVLATLISKFENFQEPSVITSNSANSKPKTTNTPSSPQPQPTSTPNLRPLPQQQHTISSYSQPSFAIPPPRPPTLPQPPIPGPIHQVSPLPAPPHHLPPMPRSGGLSPLKHPIVIPPPVLNPPNHPPRPHTPLPPVSAFGHSPGAHPVHPSPPTTTPPPLPPLPSNHSKQASNDQIQPRGVHFGSTQQRIIPANAPVPYGLSRLSNSANNSPITSHKVYQDNDSIGSTNLSLSSPSDNSRSKLTLPIPNKDHSHTSGPTLGTGSDSYTTAPSRLKGSNMPLIMFAPQTGAGLPNGGHFGQNGENNAGTKNNSEEESSTGGSSFIAQIRASHKTLMANQFKDYPTNHVLWNSVVPVRHSCVLPPHQCEGLYPVLSDVKQMFSIEEFSQQQMGQIHLNIIEDLYRDSFFTKVHYNFIGVHQSKKDDVSIVTATKPTPSNPSSICLITTKKSSKQFLIEWKTLCSYSASASLSAAASNAASGTTDKQGENSGVASTTIDWEELMVEYLAKEILPNCDVYPVLNPRFSKDLLVVEKKHPQKQSAFKIAFLYSQGQEQTLQHFFDHRDGSKRYWDFIQQLGYEIPLKGWKKYRGDIGVGSDAGTDAKSYYCEWRGIEIMFHMCCWMNAEQHRRLIGNDVVFVIFHDNADNNSFDNNGGAPFNPAPLDSLGTVPQVFIVVQNFTYQNKPGYRLGVFTRPNIKSYEPLIPMNYWVAKEDLKDVLFTKVYNGYMQALACPPMNRLFEVPRADTIATLAKKYPKESIKDIRAREKNAKALRKNIKDNEALYSKINIKVLCANISRSYNGANTSVSSAPGTSSPMLHSSNSSLGGNVSSAAGALSDEISSHGAPDCYCVIKIVEQKQKTRIMKKTYEPDWDEPLEFSVVGIDPHIHHIHVELNSKDKGGRRCVGTVDIPFNDFCAKVKEGQDHYWYLLTSDNFEAAGEICLSFAVSGQFVNCPQCELFLSNDDDSTVLFGTQSYHSLCLFCYNCLKEFDAFEQENQFIKRPAHSTNSSHHHHHAYSHSHGKLPATTVDNTAVKNGLTKGSIYCVECSEEIFGKEETEQYRINVVKKDLVPHTWVKAQGDSKLKLLCGFCNEILTGKSYQCKECKYLCHKDCKAKVTIGCLKTKTGM